MIKEQQVLEKRLEELINKTPTGELRNLLCDINIELQRKTMEIKELRAENEETIKSFNPLSDMNTYSAARNLK